MRVLSVRMLVIVVLSIVDVRGGNADFLVGLERSLGRSTLESLTLKPLCSRLTSVRVRSVVIRVSRPVVRPIVRPVALPIREVEFASGERWLTADCFFVTDIDGSLLPITLPIPRLRSVRSVERLLLTLGGVEGLIELTAGCLAPDRAEELRVPIILPIRERWLVGSFFVFETGGVMRLLEPLFREAPLERAAGCLAPLGTDGLVVLMLLPIRDVMLGLILLLVILVDRFIIVFRVLLLVRLFVFLEEFERLLDGVLVLIVLPIRDVMLELILPFVLLRLLELGTDVRELIDRLDVLLLGVRFVMARLEVFLLGVRLVIALLDVLLLGALLVMALLEVLLLGVRFVMTRLDVLLLGARLVILLLGVRLVMVLLDVVLLGALLVMLLLELRRDETLLERLDDDLLDEDLVAEDDLVDLLLERDLAAITGSQNNKSANRVQKTRKRELSRRGFVILTFEF